MSIVREDGGGLGANGAGYRIATPESGGPPAAGSKQPAGKKGGDKKGGRERKLTSDYKVMPSSSHPNAMDTLRPTAGKCENA